MKILLAFIVSLRRYIVLHISLQQATQKHPRLLCLSKIVKIRMIKVCKSCGKEFQKLTEGVLYSSSGIGVLEFCSDNCSKNYLNSVMKLKEYKRTYPNSSYMTHS